LNKKYYEINNPIIFREVEKANGWLSNDAPYPIVYSGKLYSTPQALFLALPFLQRLIFKEAELIRLEPDVFSATKLANRIILSPDFEKHEIRYDNLEAIRNMEEVLLRKVETFPILLNLIDKTEERPIVLRVDPGDSSLFDGLYWGALYINQKNMWTGKNNLGKLWEKIRSDFRKKN
jgi:predicted NAD-dependent protein-ADP-ribosyltransferase YbiA (DUF1768 family)